MDRIDLHIETPPVPFQDLKQASGGESSSAIRARVEAARDIQRHRFRNQPGVYCNAHMSTRDIRRHCRLDDAGNAILENAMLRLGLSARSYDRILKVSRTIADLERSENILSAHVAEAIQYRTLDRSA
jgi:magnesium chelatase family protein